MKKLSVTLLLLSLIGVSAYAANPGQVANDCYLYGSLLACGKAHGFSDPVWYGAIPNNNSVNNTTAYLAAANDACTGGWKRVKFQVAGKYNFQSQFNAPCSGLTTYAEPQNLMYDGGNPNSSVELYVNSGFFTTANHCFYNDNGFVDNSHANLNFGGDGGQQGLTDICNSFNYTGTGQIPRHYLYNVAFSGTGTAWGCGLNTTGVSGNATPYTGSGATCGNYMGIRAYNVTVEQSALAANGNMTDMFWKGGQVAGNACGVIVGVNNGTEGVVFQPDRVEENGIGGFSGVCGAGGPTVEVNGPLWNIDTQFQANNGVDLLFDGNCAADSIRGGYSGSGTRSVQGAESIVAFNASCGGTISFNGFAGASGFNGLNAPKYWAENITGTNKISFTGGNLDSTQYSISRDNIVAGSLTYSPLLTLGQVPVVSGAAVTPADNAACTPGNSWWDTGFLYLCTASGTVKRATLSTF